MMVVKINKTYIYTVWLEKNWRWVYYFELHFHVSTSGYQRVNYCHKTKVSPWLPWVTVATRVSTSTISVVFMATVGNAGTRKKSLLASSQSWITEQLVIAKPRASTVLCTLKSFAYSNMRVHERIWYYTSWFTRLLIMYLHRC